MARKAQPDNSAKLKMGQIMTMRKNAPEAYDVVQVKLGLKKFDVPIPAQVLEANGEVFVSFTNVASIFSISEEKKRLEPVDDLDGAYKRLLKAGKPAAAQAGPDVDEATLKEFFEFQKKLEGKGLKIGYNPKDGIKLVKPRAKKK
jgi:hypothetical protein